MKFLKTISAAAVATAIAASMALSVSATTYKDAVQAAKDAGVQDINVQELQNFLEANSDRFTSDDYDYMISIVNEVRDTYVAPLAMELFGKTPAELTEEEKTQLGQNWSQADRNAIIGALVDLGDKYDVEVDVDAISKGEYTVAATVVDDDTSSTTGKGTQVVVTPAVAATGDVADVSGVNTGAVAGAGLALVLAATGVVVVAKKNKE
jgi:hypothetical protein